MNIFPLFRPLLFRLEPERAHQLTLNLIRLAGGIQPLRWFLSRALSSPEQPVEAFGLTFSNPIGLAAGYDKDGSGWRGLACLGFGHIEVGTVTPKAQVGNPKPRIFRLKSDMALINRMGFPGKGEGFVKKQLFSRHPSKLVIGVNIGKNKATPLEDAHQDYVHLLRSFAEIADYIAVNISSPNTVGLRQLQEREALAYLLGQLYSEREQITSTKSKKIPILVKIAPDLSDSQLDDALDVILANKMDGIIATNTTLSRNGLKSSLAKETGGLSGLPLFPLSLQMVHKIHRRTAGKLPVIGVGGIINATSVQKMLDAGAVLVQVYTGLIYEGPGLVRRIMLDL